MQRHAKKILVVMPHYCKKDADHVNKKKEIRSMSLARSVSSLVQQFGNMQKFLDFSSHTASSANESGNCQCDIYICSTAEHHLLDELDIIKGLYRHVESDVGPQFLGFACREVLRAFEGKYDYFCYMEDDLFINDPLFFHKLAWFNDAAGMECLLQPNRCEVSFSLHAKKCYIDGEIPAANNPWFKTNLIPLQLPLMGADFRFRPATNPHSGCFFLNSEQFSHWLRQPHFGEWDISWVGPLESAASLGIMKTFGIYKPDWNNAYFLEVSHFGDAYLQMIGTDFVGDETKGGIYIKPLQDNMVSSIYPASSRYSQP